MLKNKRSAGFGQMKANPGPIQIQNSHRALQHGFSTRSLLLIGVGGVIGAGFFLATGMPIQKAGPSILISYMIGAFIMSQVVGAILSISVNKPDKGTFIAYAEQMLGDYLGFLQGWIYFFAGVLTISSESIAMAIFAKYWLPMIPLSILASLFVLIIIAVNSFGVKNFETLESWMSIIKIAALIGFILVAFFALMGFLSTPRLVGPAVLFSAGGFFPHGFRGVLQAMLIVIFSFGGIGVLASAAAEVSEPKQIIPKAGRGVILSISTLYLISMACLLMIYPWHQVSTTQSPFVTALTALHLPLFANVLNAIILISAFSVMAATLYSSLAILSLLAAEHKAPNFIGKRSKRGIPVGALISTSACIYILLIASYFLPSKVYNYLTSASAYFTFFNWLIMLFSFLVWRRTSYKKGDYLSKWLVVGTSGVWLTGAAILALAAYSLADADQRTGFFYALGIFLLSTAGYFVYRRRLGPTAKSG